MSFDPDRLKETGTLDQMTLDEAIAAQHRLVETVHRHLPGDESLQAGDFGQVVKPEEDLVPYGGGRPRRTHRVEQVIASFFDAEAALLVPGAGTGAIRAKLSVLLPGGGRLLVHDAPAYKTTGATLEAIGCTTAAVDFNDPESFDGLSGPAPDAALIQHVPQKPGDCYAVSEVVSGIKARFGQEFPVLVDDNYAVMRARKIGVELGAELSSFSLFKLLGPEHVGCLVGRRDLIARVPAMLASAGCQVQGPTAMEALRALVYAPVALALQKRAAKRAALQINELVAGGEEPWVSWIDEAAAIEAAHPNLVLILRKPRASELLAAGARAGAARTYVGEESRYEVLPLLTKLSSNFIKIEPEIEDYAVRINPFRSGAGLIIRILEEALTERNK